MGMPKGAKIAERPKSRQIAIRICEEDYARYSALVGEYGMTMSELFRMAMEEFIKNKSKDIEVLRKIEEKLGFSMREFGNRPIPEDVHECDNKPEPFEILTREELEFLLDHRELYM